MWLAGGVAIVLSAIAVVVAALLETGRGDGAPRRTGTVAADELRGATLPVAWRGYDRGHVDALLARAANTLDQVQRYGVLDEDADTRPAGTAPSQAPPSFLAGAVTTSDDSGEELEDRGGDDPGGLDR